MSKKAFLRPHVASPCKCALLPSGQTTSVHFEMSDLEPFHEYDFRVKAVNAVGESGCIQVAKTVVAKDKFSEWENHNSQDLVVENLSFKLEN